MREPEYKKVPVASLKAWSRNPRTLLEADLNRLIEQIKRLGVYKPLIVTADGTVIGGNARLIALTKMGVKEVWVSVVDAPDEKTMIEYALSDNDAAGSTDATKVHELVLGIPDFPLDLYRVDTGVGTLLSAIVNPPLFEPTAVDEPTGTGGKPKTTCPECGHEFTPE